MPKCVDCGKETDRELMYGPPDELRCPVCVRKLQPIYEPSYFRPEEPSQPFVTYSIIGIAVVATLARWGQFASAAPILSYLTPNPFAIWDGEVWRFLTSCFFHVNAIHLLFNLYWTWRFGRALEEWMGWLPYLGFVVLVGMGSSAAEFLYSPAPAIGLSGVGYAMFGLLLALRRDKGFAAELMQPQIIQLFVFWFFLCIVLTYSGAMPVANVAHGAGAVIGWLLGQAVLLRQRYVLVAGLTLLVAGLVVATQFMTWNRLYAIYREVPELRQLDLENATQEQIMRVIRESQRNKSG